MRRKVSQSGAAQHPSQLLPQPDPCNKTHRPPSVFHSPTHQAPTPAPRTFFSQLSSWTSAPSSWELNYIQPFSINELRLLQTGGRVAPSTSSFSSLAVAAPSFGYLCHKPFLSHPTFSSLPMLDSIQSQTEFSF